MTYILGITSPLSFNTSASLLKNGKLVAMVEEERFNRIKHSRLVTEVFWPIQ
jgi:predicted NodU family carbamoyl transferase